MSLFSFFEDLTVNDLWPQNREVVFFHQNENVIDCLGRLDSACILSAPVRNDDGEVIGVVDVLDIALFIIGIFPKDVPFEDLSKEELEKVFSTGKIFDTSKIGQVLEVSSAFKNEYQHYFVVEKTTPIQTVLEYFYQGVHRVVLLGADKKTPVNIISQFDMLTVLTQCLPFVDKETRKKTIEQLGVIKKNVIQVENEDIKTIEVLQLMQPSVDRPLISAVPILNKEGKLIANFSASNLKGLQKGNFASLLFPAITFLKLQKGNGKLQTILRIRKSLNPLTASKSDSLEQLITQMAAYKVHRIWIEEAGEVVGLVAIGDIFKIFIPWAVNL